MDFSGPVSRVMIVGILGVALGWGTGFLMRGGSDSSKKSENSFTTSGHAPEARAQTTFTPGGAGFTKSSGEVPELHGTTAGESEEFTDFDAALRSALALSDDTDRVVRLREIARSIDLTDLPAAAERAKRLSSMERWQVQQALGTRWAEIDPAAAAAFAHKSTTTQWGWNPLLNAVLTKWATTDLSAVTTWLAALPSGKRSYLTANLVTTLARRDPQSALQLIESQPGTQQMPYLHQQVFEQWAQRDAAGASVAVQNLRSGAAREQSLQAVVAGWTNESPEAAIAWAKTFSDTATRTKLLTTAANSWAEADPRAALAWTSTLDDSRLRQQLFSSTLARIAQNDPAEAQNQLRALSAGQERENAVNQVISALARHDAKSAESFLELLPEGRVRDTATANLASQMANVDPKAAGALLLTLPSAQVTDYAARIASAMATSNAEAAIEWARNLPAGQARKNALNGLCSAWAQYAPREAAEWMIKEQPGADISSVVGGWAANAPRDVLAWARTLAEGDTKRGALTMVVQTLTRNNAAEARTIFMQDLTADAQAAAAPQLAEALAKRDLAGTRAWAESLPAGAALNGAHSEIVKEWAEQDATAAAGWIERMPAGEGRDIVVTQFAGTVMRRDPESAILWAATIAEPGLRTTQLEQLANRWMQTDAGAARQWIAETDNLSEPAKHRVLNQRPVRSSSYYSGPYGIYYP